MLDNLQEYFETPIEIVFSKKRKTISIQIKPDSIRVLSTYWISKNSVREFILKNESWIRKKLADQKLRVKPVANLVNNEKLTLCGKNYTLKVISEPIIEPEIRSETIIISNNFKTMINKFQGCHLKMKLIPTFVCYIFLDLTMGQVVSFIFLLIGIYLVITKYEIKKKS